MATVALCEPGISKQGSANNGYLHMSLPPTPVIFFFPISHCWYKGVEETQQTVQEVFIHSPGKEESMPEVHGQTS